MEDPNSIAWLSLAIPENVKVEGKNGKYTWRAIRVNISQSIPPQGERDSDLGETDSDETDSDLRSRESTVPLKDREDNTQDNATYPRLQLSFSRRPKSSQGFVLGTDPNCDVVLPNLKHIGSRHCAITFDDQRRLILRDLSKTGTTVTYDTKGRELRHTIIVKDDKRQLLHHHFTWILSSPEVPKTVKEIHIGIHGICFRIIASKHDRDLDLFNANVDRFLQKAKVNEEPPFGELSIQNLIPTASLSGLQTAGQVPIHIKQKKVGVGSFAVVKHFWDVSTGLNYAYKEPLQKKFDWEMWNKEADILRQISHEHVVKLVDWIPTLPRLVEYALTVGTLLDGTRGPVIAAHQTRVIKSM